MDGTPIVDLKPYLPYADSVPEAKGGFAEARRYDCLQVEISPEIARLVPEGKFDALVEILRQDPRPHYQDDPERIYGLSFASKNIKFKVAGNTLTVIAVE